MLLLYTRHTHLAFIVLTVCCCQYNLIDFARTQMVSCWCRLSKQQSKHCSHSVSVSNDDHWTTERNRTKCKTRTHNTLTLITWLTLVSNFFSPPNRIKCCSLKRRRKREQKREKERAQFACKHTKCLCFYPEIVHLFLCCFAKQKNKTDERWTKLVRVVFLSLCGARTFFPFDFCVCELALFGVNKTKV